MKISKINTRSNPEIEVFHNRLRPHLTQKTSIPSTKLSRHNFKRMGFGPRKPTLGPITFRLWHVGIYPVLADSEPNQKFRVGFGPRTPAPGPITFRLRLEGIYPVLADSDGVGFETLRYYLIINTIKDLYCAV
jgi:hypothetical protein